MEDIHQIQQEIIHEFSLLQGNLEKILFHIVKSGQQLPPMPVMNKADEYLLKDCQSKVWLSAVLEDDQVIFYADSNTAITKGLISLLIRIFKGQSPEAILEAELYFIKKSHLERFMGTQRSNGLAAMIHQMKNYAANLPANSF